MLLQALQKYNHCINEKNDIPLFPLYPLNTKTKVHYYTSDKQEEVRMHNVVNCINLDKLVEVDVQGPAKRPP